MNTIPFRIATPSPIEIKVGAVIPAKGERGPELVTVTSISELDFDGVMLNVIGRCRPLKEGEGPT